MQSTRQVFNFGDKKLSDITVHYLSASFHMHQFVLARGSKYFKALLPISREPGSQCSLSDRCNRSSSRSCVKLLDEIGGDDISIDELNEFFRCLYADQLKKDWRQRIMSERQNDEWPAHGYFSEVVSTNEETDEIIIDVYELDGIRRHVAKGQSINHPNWSCKASSHLASGMWLENRIPSLSEHKNYHLANYFGCLSMMAVYEKQAMVIAKTSLRQRFSFELWRILLLSDRYEWTEVREFCMQACLKHKRCRKMELWKDIVTSMKPSTQAELLAAALENA